MVSRKKKVAPQLERIPAISFLIRDPQDPRNILWLHSWLVPVSGGPPTRSLVLPTSHVAMLPPTDHSWYCPRTHLTLRTDGKYCDVEAPRGRTHRVYLAEVADPSPEAIASALRKCDLFNRVMGGEIQVGVPGSGGSGYTCCFMPANSYTCDEAYQADPLDPPSWDQDPGQRSRFYETVFDGLLGPEETRALVEQGRRKAREKRDALREAIKPVAGDEKFRVMQEIVGTPAGDP